MSPQNHYILQEGEVVLQISGPTALAQANLWESVYLLKISANNNVVSLH